MKINFSTELRDPKGELIEEQEKNGKTSVYTLGKVAYNALLAQTEEEDLPSKYELYKLAKLTVEKKPVEVTVEQIAVIKKMVEKVWSTLVVGATFDIIEKS